MEALKESEKKYLLGYISQFRLFLTILREKSTVRWEMSELWDINWELLESLHCEKIKIHLRFEIQNLPFWEVNSERKNSKVPFFSFSYDVYEASTIG